MDAQLSSNDGGYFPGKVSACFEEGGNATVTFAALAQVVETIVDGFRVAARKRDMEIAELRGEIARLKELRPKYVGVFREGRVYDENSFVTHDGSIWFCSKGTSTPPGNGSASWVLACKRGERGRDASAAK